MKFVILKQMVDELGAHWKFVRKVEAPNAATALAWAKENTLVIAPVVCTEAHYEG